MIIGGEIMEIICGIYCIENMANHKKYVGQSIDIYRRWKDHKCPSMWKRQSNNPLYQDMQKYGVENFRFQILVPVMPEYLTQVEQELIEILKPTYNDRHAKGLDVERLKETKKKYHNQICFYNGETLTLCALRTRFKRAGIPHATIEAKKYLLK